MRKGGDIIQTVSISKDQARDLWELMEELHIGKTAYSRYKNPNAATVKVERLKGIITITFKDPVPKGPGKEG